MKNERIYKVQSGDLKQGPVLYRVSREIRLKNNWSLLYAQDQALKLKQPLVVCYCLREDFKFNTKRRYAFFKKGLLEFITDLNKKNISFTLLVGKPEKEIAVFAQKIKASLIVCDFDPLKEQQFFLQKISKSIKTPIHEIDAHNIIPCRYVSLKQEYAAYTLRPKIHRLLPDFLEDFPSFKKHPFSFSLPTDINKIKTILNNFKTDNTVLATKYFQGGEKAATKTFFDFLKNKITNYSKKRDDPTTDSQSNISPYLNFGFISAEKMALEIEKMPFPFETKNTFLEELIVRKELSDNFCFYNHNYDNLKCAPSWATTSLEMHYFDTRPYRYSKKQFESANTHDDLWNAAQMQMLKTGKMHGFLRMYWAKKILEWSNNPTNAFETAVYLNDKYSLDGCNPCGYSGIAWSICGVHDRAWFEREIFGKIRYMNYNGCKKKFNIPEYIKYVNTL